MTDLQPTSVLGGTACWYLTSLLYGLYAGIPGSAEANARRLLRVRAPLVLVAIAAATFIAIWNSSTGAPRTAPAADPATALGVVLATAFLLMLVETAIARLPRTVQLSRPCERAMRRSAVHESGHALAFGFAYSAPSTLDVSLHWTRCGHARTLGSITTTLASDAAGDEDQDEFLMLLSLAGIAAERSVYGDCGRGSASDYAHWLDSATTYLADGFGGAYHAQPANDIELALNRQTLDALRDSQQEELAAFFRDNQALLCELAEELYRKERLALPELHSYLARVSVRRRLQVPFGTVAA